MLQQDESKIHEIKIHPFSTSIELENPNSFSLLSWNIMYKSFVDKEDYPYCTDNQLNWINRLPKIKKILSNYNTDIICLQEVDKFSFKDDIGNYFETNYGYSFIVNITKKNKADFTQCIMYKNNKFECKYHEFRSRCTILLLTDKIHQNKCNKCNINNICIYHSFFIISVHLDSKPESTDIRLNQIKKTLNRLNDYTLNILKLSKSQIDQIRVIIVGDHNTGMESNIGKMLLFNNNGKYKHDYKFKEAYHEAIIYKYSTNDNNNNNDKVWSNPNWRIKYFPSFAACNLILSIDLMFYTENNLKLKAVSNTLPIETQKKLNWRETIQKRIDEWIKNGKQKNLADFDKILLLPNDQFPSDHLPISAVFEYNDLCNDLNQQNQQCLVCGIKSKLTSKANNKIHKNEWKWHEMHSF